MYKSASLVGFSFSRTFRSESAHSTGGASSLTDRADRLQSAALPSRWRHRRRPARPRGGFSNGGGGAWKRPVRARGMPLCYRDAIFSLRSGCKVAPRRREGKSAGDGWLMTETSSLLMSSLDDVILLNYQLLVVISVYRMFTYLVLLPTHAIWILK